MNFSRASNKVVGRPNGSGTKSWWRTRTCATFIAIISRSLVKDEQTNALRQFCLRAFPRRPPVGRPFGLAALHLSPLLLDLLNLAPHLSRTCAFFSQRSELSSPSPMKSEQTNALRQACPRDFTRPLSRLSTVWLGSSAPLSSRTWSIRSPHRGEYSRGSVCV